MQDIVVITPKTIPTDEFVAFVRAYASRIGQPLQRRERESVIGREPDTLSIVDDTAARNAYFSDEEKTALEAILSFAVKGCASFRFETEIAFRFADDLAREVQRRWDGVIDYSGAGGGLGTAPSRIA